MAVFKSGRWRSESTGRWVKNVTVAKQLSVPRRAVSGTHRAPARWTEVTAVCRIKIGPKGKERYVEAVRRVTIHDAKRKDISKARSIAKKWVIANVGKKLGRSRISEKAMRQLKTQPKKIGRMRTVIGVEVRRRRRRPKAGKRVEVRDTGRYKVDEYEYTE
jgi:hypothetical protein